MGSVKSNFGHLTPAAGVAGLTNTTLAMRHGVLPASINFTQPNPALGLESSPFYINDRLNEWKGEKRRAGISSFGVGGTNVHVVVESYPAPLPTVAPSEEDWQLITWSAHSVQSASAYGTQLAEYVKRHPSVSLGAIGNTLQATRKEYIYKRFLVAKNAADVQTALQDPLQTKSPVPSATAPEAVFIFPGQGTHYPFMGRGIPTLSRVSGSSG